MLKGISMIGFLVLLPLLSLAEHVDPRAEDHRSRRDVKEIEDGKKTSV